MYIVNFSGGKDSTAMLLKLLENGNPIDKIIYVETGMEFPAMQVHLKKVEKFAGIEISRFKAERSFEYWLSDHVRVKGSMKGIKGYGWPNILNRWCTSNLKLKIIKKSSPKNAIHYVGISADELNRVSKVVGENRVYPLIDLNMKSIDCLKYCYSKGFDWGGLYEEFQRVSCWCCPLQSIEDLRTLYRYYPGLWERLKEMDNSLNYQTDFKYKAGKSVLEWEERFIQTEELIKE